MGGSSPPPANTTSTTEQEPWSGAKPYLTGGARNTGVFPAAEQYFNQYSQLDPVRQGFNSDYFGQLYGRSKELQDFDLGQQFLDGQFDPAMNQARGFTGNASTAQAYGTNAVANNRALGANDPTQALSQTLSGRPNNPLLGDMHQANINTSLRGYNDAIRGLTTSVLPQIGSEAFASGGYGGSRQGVAEGMALEQMQRNARDLGIAAMDSGNQIYGAAYENAQGRMADTANNLTGMAQQIGQFNAGQNQNTSQFNAQASDAMKQFNLGNLQNADQFNAQLDMQRKAAMANNAMQGMNIYKDLYGAQDNIFNQQQQLLGANQAQAENALNLYANIISPGAGMGGISASNQQIPIYSSTGSQLLGGAASLAGLLGSLK